jgi:uncharacterized phage infection (PIP) family protein YhgE
MTETSASIPIAIVRPSAHKLPAGKIAFGVLLLLLVLLAVGAGLVYTSEERNLTESRQASAALAAQLAQAQQETRDRQADLDGTKQQLAQAQAETATAQANGKTLADQLAQAQQQSQQSEAKARTLQSENANLNGQLSTSAKEAQDAQAKNTSLTQKATSALAKAQLMDEYFSLQMAVLRGDRVADTRKGLTAWFRKLYTLNDPTIDGYLEEYDTAMTRNPKDTQASGQFLSKLMAYLSGSVVGSLQ